MLYWTISPAIYFCVIILFYSCRVHSLCNAHKNRLLQIIDQPITWWYSAMAEVQGFCCEIETWRNLSGSRPCLPLRPICWHFASFNALSCDLWHSNISPSSKSRHISVVRTVPPGWQVTIVASSGRVFLSPPAVPGYDYRARVAIVILVILAPLPGYVYST